MSKFVNNSDEHLFTAITKIMHFNLMNLLTKDTLL